jgi:23S rRNA pseudouridine2605 synthase
MKQRLQKLLAASGVSSRRKSEELIAEGRVRVNGAVAAVGSSADPGVDEVTVDGAPVTFERKRYILLNKPRGVTSTTSDPHAEQTVLDLVDVPERVYPVGRLDEATEGLLLLTNDGDWANRVIHPRYGVEKAYVAELDRLLDERTLRRLIGGVDLDDGPAKAIRARFVGLVSPSSPSPSYPSPTEGEGGRTDRRVVELVLHEGRKRIVRRMFRAVGAEVVRLTRTRVGSLTLDGVALGAWRELTEDEVLQLGG